jgi:hypothetical protein
MASSELQGFTLFSLEKFCFNIGFDLRQSDMKHTGMFWYENGELS